MSCNVSVILNIVLSRMASRCCRPPNPIRRRPDISGTRLMEALEYTAALQSEFTNNIENHLQPLKLINYAESV